MRKQEIYTKLKDLVGQGKTKEALEWLHSITLDKQSEQALTLIESKHNTLKQSEIKGLLSFDEIQRQKNQINDQLLGLFQEDLNSKTSPGSKNNLFKIFIPLGIVLLGMAGAFWWMNQPTIMTCPTFKADINNKIIVLPFENVGSESAKPQVVLRDRINQLAQKNRLSSNAKLGESINLTMDEAPELAAHCSADLLVWGTYSSKTDSLHLVMQYYFANQPDWSSYGDLVKLKDVTALQNGSMLKTMDDAILSLCGIIALREKDNALAEKWFEKVKGKETLDKDVLKIMKN